MFFMVNLALDNAYNISNPGAGRRVDRVDEARLA